MTVSSDGTVTLYDVSSNTSTEFTAGEASDNSGNVTVATVKNFSGYALPATGGPGTNLFYLLGIMLTGLAGAGLAMKKRGNTA